jgi:hypothetical protein
MRMSTLHQAIFVISHFMLANQDFLKGLLSFFRNTPKNIIEALCYSLFFLMGYLTFHILRRTQFMLLSSYTVWTKLFSQICYTVSIFFWLSLMTSKIYLVSFGPTLTFSYTFTNDRRYYHCFVRYSQSHRSLVMTSLTNQ